MNPAILNSLANQLNNPDNTSISFLQGQMILRIKTAKHKGIQEVNAISLIKGQTDKLFYVSVVKSKKLEALLLSQHVKIMQMDAVPVYITYITCEIKNGEPVTYKDIYGLDNGLKRALYRAAAKKDL
jgi:murein L,D-transpeptidase YcbB/YkuD